MCLSFCVGREKDAQICHQSRSHVTAKPSFARFFRRAGHALHLVQMEPGLRIDHVAGNTPLDKGGNQRRLARANEPWAETDGHWALPRCVFPETRVLSSRARIIELGWQPSSEILTTRGCPTPPLLDPVEDGVVERHWDQPHVTPKS